ncbi:MAG: hypothetical protein HY458_02120 [Parcubacteria group bacterium]|nr:hypothetical protein [Parcubacteria group bacterium]
MAENDKSYRNDHPKSEEMRGKRICDESRENGWRERSKKALLMQQEHQHHEWKKRGKASEGWKRREKAHLQEHRSYHQEE